jgi:putative transposase
MGNRRRSQGIRVKYAFIKAHRSEFDTAVMCRLLDVSRSGFYEWLRNPLSDRALEDQRLLGLIRAAYTASHGVYGAPRIFLDLREAGETCSKHRVARIMRANNMKALHGYRAPGTPEATRHSLRPIHCNEALPSNDRTKPGSPTSLTCARGKAGSILPS